MSTRTTTRRVWMRSIDHVLLNQALPVFTSDGSAAKNCMIIVLKVEESDQR